MEFAVDLFGPKSRPDVSCDTTFEVKQQVEAGSTSRCGLRENF